MTKPNSPDTQASSQLTEGLDARPELLRAFALRESVLEQEVHLVIDSVRRGPHVRIPGKIDEIETSDLVQERRVYVAPRSNFRKMLQDLIDRLDELS